MVAEMMILAGEAVGALGGTLKVPLPYRGQAEPMLPGGDTGRSGQIWRGCQGGGSEAGRE